MDALSSTLASISNDRFSNIRTVFPESVARNLTDSLEVANINANLAIEDQGGTLVVTDAETEILSAELNLVDQGGSLIIDSIFGDAVADFTYGEGTVNADIDTDFGEFDVVATYTDDGGTIVVTSPTLGELLSGTLTLSPNTGVLAVESILGPLEATVTLGEDSATANIATLAGNLITTVSFNDTGSLLAAGSELIAALL